MRLNNKDLYDFFVEKNINRLYHANTVSTSSTFLQNSGLMSRGTVEKMNLYQTNQSSDYKDKQINVWDDIFLDTADLHKHFKRGNLYGPVLFELNNELLLNEEFEIWITKDNPLYWNINMDNEERYFVSVEELREKWDSIDRQKKMITIRNANSPILFEYVNKVVVDDPNVIINEIGGKKQNVFITAQNKLMQNVSEDHILKNKFFTREKCGYCFCTYNYLYQNSSDQLKKLFF